MSAGRIVLLVFGILFVLAALGMIMGGGVLLALDSGFKDDKGFFVTGFQSLRSDSAAIISQPAKIHWDTGWERRNRSPVTIKIEAYNDDSSRPIFIGIARDSDLNDYLKGVPYDEITGFNLEPNEVELWRHTGAAVAALPARQNFWVASATGTGHQTFTWDIASGNYSLVVMNADASTPIATHLSAGAKIAGIIHAVGLGLLIGGIIVLLIGGVMIFFAARGW